MATVTLTTRIGISLVALAVTWLACGASTALRFLDPQIALLFFVWSLPFFAVAWIVAGVPIIAMGNLALRIPTVLVALAGALGGVFVLFLPLMLEWARDLTSPVPGVTHSIHLPWSYMKGWPVFCALLGACGTVLYRWLLSQATPPST
jgi:hypothetical protein